MINIKSLWNWLHTPKWLAILIVIVLILRIPTFFEPYSYGDEMIYLTLGEGIKRGVTLYKDIHDNKPPLLYITAALAGSLFWFKAILAVWHIVTVYIFWKLSDVLFPKNTKLQQVSTIIFALFSTFPLLEGNIANAENFMIAPMMLAFYILLSKDHSVKNLLLAGALFSIGILFKIPAIFDIPAIIFLWLATTKLKLKNVKQIIKNSIVLLFGMALPIVFTFIYYWLKGAFNEYLIAAYLQNFGYLSSWRPSDVREPFLVKNGPLLLRGAVITIAHIIIFIFRKRLSKQFIFISSWLLLTLFAVTLSERPYPHYLLQSLPAVSLLFGILLAKKSIEQPLVILPLFSFFFVPFFYNFWYYPTAPYYSKFINLMTGKISREDYFRTFGQDVPRNYKIANFLVNNTKREDSVFVWGDTAKIYALSRRLPPIKYVADYHIKDFWSREELIKELYEKNTEIIVVLPESEDFEELDRLLRSNHVLIEEIDGAQIWKLLSPGVRNLIAP